MARLIAFDLDGTLVDSQLDLAESANEMLAGYGARPLSVETVSRFIGEGARQLVSRTLVQAGLETDVSEALSRFLDIYAVRLLNHTRPYPGIPEVLQALAGRAELAVVTNKPEAPSRRILEAFGMADLFRSVIGGDSPFGRKPDPAGLLHVIDEAGARPEGTLFVGDSDVDVETARRAGTGICIAQYGFGQVRQAIALQGDELVANRPGDLAGILQLFLGTSKPSSPKPPSLP